MCDCMDCWEKLSSQSKSTSLVRRVLPYSAHTHGHAALEYEAARSPPHQEGHELHLSPVAEFRLRTEAKLMSGEDHISTLVAIY